MEYDTPITGVAHAEWCLAEAARRYHGRVVIVGGFPLIEDAAGTCHTDAVLRAIGEDWSEVAASV